MGRAELVGSSLRQGWAVAGLATLTIVVVVAAANLNEIYQSQKDFVTGSLLSLAGFCFGKAFSRTHEQKALELIRDAPAGEVSDAVDRAATASLSRRGAFETLARLERDLQAASERMTEYYDSFCRSVELCSAMAVLRVALEDLDKALSNTIELRSALKMPDDHVRTYSIDPGDRLSLIHIGRDYREAIGRRDQAYDWYRPRLDRSDQTSWDIFAVMTSDMLKGERLLGALLARSLQSPPEEYLQMVDGYVRAAIRRADEFVELTAAKGLGPPKVFDVMRQDLSKALAAIDRLTLGAPVAAGSSPPG